MGIEYYAFRHHGTTPVKRAYHAGQFMGPQLGANAAATANLLYALPYPVARQEIAQEMLIFTTTTFSGGKVRTGIYNNASVTNPYPSTLLVDAGEQSLTTSGLKTFPISVALAPDSVFWFVMVMDNVVNVRVFNTVDGWPLLGVNPNDLLDSRMGWNIAFAYAALPGTFPGSANYISTAAFTKSPVIAITLQADVCP